MTRDQQQKDVKVQELKIAVRKAKMKKFRQNKNLRALKRFSNMNESAKLIYKALLNYRSIENERI